MSTRHAQEGAPISYERYMSSPEFAEMRGIPGTAVAAKAQLYANARKRSLLFFLQSLSLKDGGLRKVARALNFSGRGQDEVAGLLVDLCINPKFVIDFASESSLRGSSLPLCKRIADAVREYQDAYEARVKEEFVLTTIGKEIFETLDHALEIGRRRVGKECRSRWSPYH